MVRKKAREIVEYENRALLINLFGASPLYIFISNKEINAKLIAVYRYNTPNWTIPRAVGSLIVFLWTRYPEFYLLLPDLL
jgi:hypothetical protein